MKINRLWPARRVRATRSGGEPPPDELPARGDAGRTDPVAAEPHAAHGRAAPTGAGRDTALAAAAPPEVENPRTAVPGTAPDTGVGTPAPPGVDHRAPSPDGSAAGEELPPPAAKRRLSARDRKRVVYAAAAAVVVILLWLWLRPSPLDVEGEEITRGPLQVTIDEDGTTRVRERFVIAAPVSGRLQRVDLEEGDAVQAGMVIARLAPIPLDAPGTVQARARLQAAEAQRDAAAARAQQATNTLEQTRRETARTRVLAEAGAESRERREIAETALRNAEREAAAALDAVSAASAEVDAARAGLVNTNPVSPGGGAVVPVPAPTGGRVLRVLETSDRVVAAGTPILEIGDARALEAVVDVLSSDAVRIAPGARVSVEEWGGGAPLQGTVVSVEPAAFTRVSALGVEEQRVNVIVALPGAPASLGDGFRVEARVVVWSNPAALRVPIGALFRHGSGWGVFVVDGGRARVREVAVGERGASHAEVTAGLAEGESVVVYPPDELEDGSRVRVR